MAVVEVLPEVRSRGNVPENPDPRRAGGARRHPRIAGQHLERPLVVGLPHPHEQRVGGWRLQAPLERPGRGIIEIAAAPHEASHGIEPVLLQRLDQGRIERRAAGRRPERAILNVPSCPAGDLAELGRQQVSVLAAVELPPAGKGDMGDVHVQPHADGVGGHQVVDLAGFVQRDLRVAGARAEGAEDDGRPAVPPAHLLGDPVDVVGGKGDDGGTPRQAGQLALAAPAQRREPGPLLDFGARQDAPENRAHRRGAQEHGFRLPARVQEAVREHVPAFRVRGQLHLVHGQELDVEIARDGLRGRGVVARTARNDPLLTGDQRRCLSATDPDDAVVDLARQQTQRASDQPAGVAQHPVDGQVRLAGIGRPEHHPEPRPFRVPIHRYRLPDAEWRNLAGTPRRGRHPASPGRVDRPGQPQSG